MFLLDFFYCAGAGGPQHDSPGHPKGSIQAKVTFGLLLQVGERLFDVDMCGILCMGVVW